MNQQNINYVLRSVEQRDIRFVRLWFVDILGRLKNFAISPEDLEVALRRVLALTAPPSRALPRPRKPTCWRFPMPRPSRFCRGARATTGVARVFCDVCTPDRKPFAGDPRDALRRMFYKAEKAGYLLNVGAELEYYYFPDEHTPEPLDNVGYFDLSVSDAARDLRRNTVLTLEKMSVPVEYTFHAAGRSQHGMSLRHAEALSMSDAITTAKLIIKQQAYRERVPRLLYAQAVGGRGRQRYVPVPVAIRPRRQQRLLGRGRREVPPLRYRQALHGRHLGARARDQRHH